MLNKIPDFQIVQENKNRRFYSQTAIIPTWQQLAKMAGILLQTEAPVPETPFSPRTKAE